MGIFRINTTYVLPCLAFLIAHEDVEVVTDACWALSYATDGTNEQIQAVLECGVVERLVELLAHPSTAVQTPALRALGNIVTGDDAQTQAVIDAVKASGMLVGLVYGSPKPPDTVLYTSNFSMKLR